MTTANYIDIANPLEGRPQLRFVMNTDTGTIHSEGRDWPTYDGMQMPGDVCYVPGGDRWASWPKDARGRLI